MITRLRVGTLVLRPRVLSLTSHQKGRFLTRTLSLIYTRWCISPDQSKFTSDWGSFLVSFQSFNCFTWPYFINSERAIACLSADSRYDSHNFTNHSIGRLTLLPNILSKFQSLVKHAPGVDTISANRKAQAAMEENQFNGFCGIYKMVSFAWSRELKCSVIGFDDPTMVFLE